MVSYVDLKLQVIEAFDIDLIMRIGDQRSQGVLFQVDKCYHRKTRTKSSPEHVKIDSQIRRSLREWDVPGPGGRIGSRQAGGRIRHTTAST